MKFRRLSILSMTLALVLCTCAPAFALTDTAGNGFEFDRSVNDIEQVQGDLYVFAQVVDLSNSTVKKSILLFAQDATIGGSKVADSLRGAAQTLKVSNTTFGGNVDVAAEKVSIGTGVKASAVHLMASKATYAGQANALSIRGDDIVISGRVDGDVSISGNHVTVTDSAVITGTLTVRSPNEPTVQNGARIGACDFIQGHDAISSIQAPSLAPVFGAASVIADAYLLLVLIIAAFVAAWLARKPVERSAVLFRKRWGWTLLSGFIFLIIAPIIFALLIILLVTIPLAFVFLFACILLACVAVPFTAASLPQAVFPKLNRFLSALIGAFVIGALLLVPLLVFPIFLLSNIYIFGSILQCWYMRNRQLGSETDSAPIAPPRFDESAASDSRDAVVAEGQEDTDGRPVEPSSDR